MPSVTAGIGLGYVNSIIKAVGHHDFAFFVGGAIAGFPLGLREGSSLFVQVVQAAAETEHFSGDDYVNIFSKKQQGALEASGWVFHDWDKFLEDNPEVTTTLSEMRIE